MTMVPEYSNGPFEMHRNAANEESVTVPVGIYSAAELDRLDLSLTDHTEGKWYVRLQMPGCLDATEWDGPFDTEEDARRHVEDAWEVDPDSGEPLAEQGAGENAT